MKKRFQKRSIRTVSFLLSALLIMSVFPMSSSSGLEADSDISVTDTVLDTEAAVDTEASDEAAEEVELVDTTFDVEPTEDSEIAVEGENEGIYKEYKVALKLFDGKNYLQPEIKNAVVTLSNGSESFSSKTNVSGIAIFAECVKVGEKYSVQVEFNGDDDRRYIQLSNELIYGSDTVGWVKLAPRMYQKVYNIHKLTSSEDEEVKITAELFGESVFAQNEIKNLTGEELTEATTPDVVDRGDSYDYIFNCREGQEYKVKFNFDAVYGEGESKSTYQYYTPLEFNILVTFDTSYEMTNDVESISQDTLERTKYDIKLSDDYQNNGTVTVINDISNNGEADSEGNSYLNGEESFDNTDDAEHQGKTYKVLESGTDYKAESGSLRSFAVEAAEGYFVNSVEIKCDGKVVINYNQDSTSDDWTVELDHFNNVVKISTKEDIRIRGNVEITVGYAKKDYSISFTIDDEGKVHLDDPDKEIEEYLGSVVKLIKQSNSDSKPISEITDNIKYGTRFGVVVDAEATDSDGNQPYLHHHIKEFSYTTTDARGKETTEYIVQDNSDNSVKRRLFGFANNDYTIKDDDLLPVIEMGVKYEFTITLTIDRFDVGIESYLDSEKNAPQVNDKYGNAKLTCSIDKQEYGTNGTLLGIQYGNNGVQVTVETKNSSSSDSGNYHIKEIIVDNGDDNQKYTLTLSGTKFEESDEPIHKIKHVDGNLDKYQVTLDKITANTTVQVVYAADETLYSDSLSILNQTNTKSPLYITEPDAGENPRNTDVDGVVRLLYMNDTGTVSIQAQKVGNYEVEQFSVVYNDSEDSVYPEDGKVNIGSTKTIKFLRAYYNLQWHTVKYQDGNIMVVRDNTAPAIDSVVKKTEDGNKIASDKWTNTKELTITGTIKAEGKEQSPLKGVVWFECPKNGGSSTDVVSSDNAKKILFKDSDPEDYPINCGIISFDKNEFSKTVKDECDSTYYFYVFDVAGNCAVYENLFVGIDRTPAYVSYINFYDSNNSEKLLTFDEEGVTVEDSVKIKVEAHDSRKVVNSGISKINIIYENTDSKVKTLIDTLDITSNAVQYTLKNNSDEPLHVSITAQVIDAAGNVIVVSPQNGADNNKTEQLDYCQSNSVNGNVHIYKDIKSKLKPSVTIIEKAPEGNAFYNNKKDGELWFKNGNVNISYFATEESAGFSSYTLKLNGRDITGQDEDVLKALRSTNNTTFNSVKNDRFNISKFDDNDNSDKDFIKSGENKISLTVVSRVKDSDGNYYSETFSAFFYIDETNPEITDIAINKISNAVGSALNVLSFGLFSNTSLSVDVTVSDAVPTSGYQQVMLYLNDEVVKTETEVKENKVRFTVPLEDILDDNRKCYVDGSMTVRVVDNVTNESGRVEPTKWIDENRDNRIIIENVLPIISPIGYNERPLSEEKVNKNTFNGDIWYNGDVPFIITVQDKESGVGEVEVTINDTHIGDFTSESSSGKYLFSSKLSPELTEIKNEFNDSATVRTNADGVKDKDGQYVVTVNAWDNAGNQAAMQSLTVYKDVNAPKIERFEFSGTGSRYGDGTPNDSVDLTDYGYYFKENTVVTVYAVDNGPSSGINNIYFKAVSVDSKEADIKPIVRQVEAVTVNGVKCYCAKFEVNSGFKGQVLACVDDNVGNTTGKYVTPSGTIIETLEQHEQDNERIPHIKITRSAAPYKTSENQDLYSNDVDVTFEIYDDYSGIDSVSLTIDDTSYGLDKIENTGNAVGDTINGWTVVETDHNLVTKLSRTITVTNNINNIPILVSMSDRSGNLSSLNDYFSIDKTEPKVQITWDDTTPDSGTYYNKKRTATITVTERNFNSGNVHAEDMPALSAWTMTGGEGDSKTYVATVTYSTDGEFEPKIYCIDLAGNQSSVASASKFIMDFTAPVISVTYDGESKEAGYFLKEAAAVIKITEKNFDSSRVEIVGSGDLNGNKVDFPKLSSWTDSGDVHTATVLFSEDAIYKFTVNAKDKAGNGSVTGFKEDFLCIDKIDPEIIITGVKDKSANNGEVAPVVTVRDNNFKSDDVSIQLKRASKGNEITPNSGSWDTNGNAVERVFTFNDFEREKDVDDLYILTVNVSDLAGRKMTETINFSVNRFGSVFAVSDESLKISGQYISQEQDVVLNEYNVDKVQENTVKVRVIRNNISSDLTMGSDFTLESAAQQPQDSWYVNKYTVHASNFAMDGNYSVDIYNQDKAKNDNSNVAQEDDEEHHPEIEFTVDKTVPVVTPINFDTDQTYSEPGKNLEIEVKDNIILESCKFMIDGKEVEAKLKDYTNNSSSDDSASESDEGTESDDTLESQNNDKSGVYIIHMSESNDRQSIKVVAVDCAGNTNEADLGSIVVSTNAFIRWINNTPVFIGSILGILVLIAGIVFAAMRLSKRKES